MSTTASMNIHNNTQTNKIKDTQKTEQTQTQQKTLIYDST